MSIYSYRMQILSYLRNTCYKESSLEQKCSEAESELCSDRYHGAQLTGAMSLKLMSQLGLYTTVWTYCLLNCTSYLTEVHTPQHLVKYILANATIHAVVYRF